MATMKEMKSEYPKVSENFLNMVTSIKNDIVFDEKTLQLHCLSILTAIKALEGIEVHTKMALDAGASKGEITSAIICCLPTCGIGSVMSSMEAAFKILE